MLTLEPIVRRQFSDVDLAKVQDEVIADVQARPEAYLARYVENPSSARGRYVNSDLMKETIPAYAASRESRGRYNIAVHNSAAALAAAQFRGLVRSVRPRGMDTAVFLTGMPGAGKSTFYQQSQGLGEPVWLLFEGQLAKPETTLPKIEAAISAGMTVAIAVVHPLPEEALRNTFRRFREVGRGAGLEALAQIGGHLPAGLQAVRDKFGDTVSLRVYDVRDRQNAQVVEGWSALDILRSEQGYDEIKHRLSIELERCYRGGDIDEECYRQARGEPPRFPGLGSSGIGRGSPLGHERGRAPESGPAPLVDPSGQGGRSGRRGR